MSFSISSSQELTCEKAMATELGIHFLETSAKSSHNVEEAFTKIARELMQTRYEYNMN